MEMKQLDAATAQMADLLGSPVFPEDSDGARRRLAFLGYFPCPIRAQIRDLVHAMVCRDFSTRPGGGAALPWYVPGGCGGKDAYEELWRTENADELPEIILSIDFGDFWQPEFRRKFIDTGLFGPVGPDLPSPAFQAAGLPPSPLGYSILAVFPNVLLVDLNRLDGRPVPGSWHELLDPDWRGDIAIGGHKEDMATLLPLFIHRQHGDDGLRALAANVKALRHAAQMAKLAGSGNPEGSALSVMPWFFADSCPNPGKTHVVIPREGALASPIYVLAKKSRSRAADAILELLFSPTVAAVCRQNWFPSAVEAPPVPGQDRSALDRLSLHWLGWDYLLGQDLSALKAHVERVFRADWRGVIG